MSKGIMRSALWVAGDDKSGASICMRHGLLSGLWPEATTSPPISTMKLQTELRRNIELIISHAKPLVTALKLKVVAGCFFMMRPSVMWHWLMPTSCIALSMSWGATVNRAVSESASARRRAEASVPNPQMLTRGDTVGSKRPFDWALTWLETAKTLSISESVKSVRLSFMRDMSDSGLKGDRDCSMRLSSMMTESSRFMGES